MEAIREQVSKPLVAGIIGFVIGAIFGLVFLGWNVWPVKYVGAGPGNMAQPEQVEYLRMAVEAFGQNQDVTKANARYQALGENGPEALQQLQAETPPVTRPELVQAFAAAVGAGTTAPVLTPPPPGATVLPTTTPAAAGGVGGVIRSVLPLLCLIFAVLAFGFIVYFVVRSRGPAGKYMGGQQVAPPAAYTDYTATGAEPPMVQFMAAYKLGDDLFDDSFSIDSPAGEFMGECGVGISEPIGVGDPKKVTAFEVWLFDKNDIQTVTKVLMSAHAFSDDATRLRLKAKGEPIMIEPGTEIPLETQTLHLVARVVDMGYGEGALPPQSFFDRFILELAVWPKETNDFAR